MDSIRSYIESHLLAPLKEYPTKIQDAMIEIIIDRLEELYTYTLRFPEIVTPSVGRLDILRVIADQFLFTIRDDADLQEQVNILTNILYVYSRRGSIDTIENMWKYYGGQLPKDVEVIIPSYKIFRYSISKLSGTHVFQDNGTNRPGVYEIKLINNTYPIPDLKDFLMKELVAAGTEIYFSNAMYMDILSDSQNNPYRYNVSKETSLILQFEVLKLYQGLTWSGYNPLSKKSEDSAWSGRGAIFVDLEHLYDLDMIELIYGSYETGGVDLTKVQAACAEYDIDTSGEYELLLNSFLHCTPLDTSVYILRYLYDSDNNQLESDYPGYFVLGESLLGKEIL